MRRNILIMPPVVTANLLSRQNRLKQAVQRQKVGMFLPVIANDQARF